MEAGGRLASVGAWGARPRAPEPGPEKALKEAGGKALVARGLEDTPTPTPTPAPGSELDPGPLIPDRSDDDALPDAGPTDWLLRRVMECDGERGWLRSVPRARLLLRRGERTAPEGVWRGESDPGLLPDEDCRVTDSKIREWASLGVKRGALRSGLRFWRGGASNREDGGGWWWWWWRGGEKRREPDPDPPPWAGKPPGAAPPPGPAPPGIRPTSSAVRGGGRKLSKTGFLIRPSLAYLAEEK